MMKNWRLPAVILGILILAFILRWDNVSSSTNNGVLREYKVDRWTGNAWVETFSNNNHTLKCLDYNGSGGNITIGEYVFGFPSPERKNGYFLTLLWYGFIAIDTVWLLLAIKSSRKNKVKKKEQEINA